MGIVSVEALTERLHDVAGETELERAVLSTKLRRFQTWCRGVDLVAPGKQSDRPSTHEAHYLLTNVNRKPSSCSTGVWLRTATDLRRKIAAKR